MKKISFIIFAAVLLASCLPKKEINNNNNRINRYFPEVLGEIVLNMPFEDVIKLRPNIAPVNYVNDAFNFRKEYVEEINQDGIQKVVYFFDADNHVPLYEAVIIFDSEKKRDSEASRLLGQPNYENNTEWILDSRQNFKVKAWKFENKLVVAGIIKGTEWEE